MTNLVLIGALVAALVTAALAYYSAARARIVADRRIRAAADRFAASLGESGELAASLDPSDVAQRTLAAVMALPGVDASLLETVSPAGARTRTAHGVSDADAEKLSARIPGAMEPGAAIRAHHFGLDDIDRPGSALRAGLVVPLTSDGRQTGRLAAFTRSAAGAFPDEAVSALERLALRAGPALDNAHRFVRTRLLADVDSLTGLQNRRRFHEQLAREVARASRYGRKLALIVIDLDDFKAVNDRVGHLSGDLVLAEIATRVRAVVRAADIACRVGGDEFGVIMPESGVADAELLASRISRMVSDRPLGQGDTLNVSAGVAELKEDDDANALFERADEALYRAKQAGKGRTSAAP